MIFRHLPTSSTSTSSAFLKQGNCDGLGCGIEDLGAHGHGIQDVPVAMATAYPSASVLMKVRPWFCDKMPQWCSQQHFFSQSKNTIVKVKRTKYSNRANGQNWYLTHPWENLIQDALKEAGWTDLNLGTKLSKPGWLSSFCLDPQQDLHISCHPFLQLVIAQLHSTSFFIWRCDAVIVVKMETQWYPSCPVWRPFSCARGQCLTNQVASGALVNNIVSL